MATVLVTYNFNSFKANISRNSSLNDVLIQSLNNFKLIENESEAKNWFLSRSNTKVALDIPWAFLNLPTGVKLALIKKDILASSIDNENQPTLLKIKFQVPESPAVVASVNNKESLKVIIDKLAQDSDWFVDPSTTTLQVFAKVIKYDEFEQHTLGSLGITSPVSIRLNIKANINTEKGNEETSVIDKNEKINKKISQELTQVEIPKVQHELYKIAVFLPTNDTQIENLSERKETGEFEMTIAQARKYQNMLSRKAGTLGGPLLTKRLREKYEADVLPKKSEILTCMIRIRFPDRTNIELAFKPDDTLVTIYKVLSQALINEHHNFALWIAYPHQILEKNSKKLLDDLKFGSKTLLLLESEKGGPYLKPDLIQNAKSMDEANDVKLDRLESTGLSNTDGSAGSKGNVSKSQNPVLLNKVPNWLKLGKK